MGQTSSINVDSCKKFRFLSTIFYGFQATTSTNHFYYPRQTKAAQDKFSKSSPI